MKRKLVTSLVVVMFLFGLAGIASATVLTFDDSSNLGVNLAGSMQWNGTGGGHLYMESYADTDYIMMLPSNTFVNDFQMNYQPWENYGLDPATTGGWLVDIKAFDASNNVIWSNSVDLTSTASSWNNWLTISINTANVAALSFSPTGGPGQGGIWVSGYWPSIDNMRINENAPVPEPSTFLLFGAGLVGVAFLRKRMRR